MRKMKGLTFIGMLLVMTVVIVFGLLLMRIIPVYIQHYEIVHSLKSLNSLPKDQFENDPTSSAIVLKRMLQKQFEVNSINDINDENISIIPQNENTVKVTIKYQAVRPFISNISLLFNFEDSQEVTFGSQ